MSTTTEAGGRVTRSQSGAVIDGHAEPERVLQGQVQTDTGGTEHADRDDTGPARSPEPVMDDALGSTTLGNAALPSPEAAHEVLGGVGVDNPTHDLSVYVPEGPRPVRQQDDTGNRSGTSDGRAPLANPEGVMHMLNMLHQALNNEVAARNGTVPQVTEGEMLGAARAAPTEQPISESHTGRDETGLSVPSGEGQPVPTPPNRSPKMEENSATGLPLTGNINTDAFRQAVFEELQQMLHDEPDRLGMIAEVILESPVFQDRLGAKIDQLLIQHPSLKQVKTVTVHEDSSTDSSSSEAEARDEERRRRRAKTKRRRGTGKGRKSRKYRTRSGDSSSTSLTSTDTDGRPAITATDEEKTSGDSSDSSSSSSDDKKTSRRNRNGKKNKSKKKKRRSSSSSDSSTDTGEEDERDSDGRRLRPIQPTNELFTDAVNYQTYRLTNRSKRYNSSVSKRISKMQKGMNVQLQSQKFDGTDPVTVINFLDAFQTACDTNGIHEGAAMWLFQFFLKNPAQATVKARLAADSPRKKKHRIGSSSRRHLSNETEKLCSYVEVVQFLLLTYATDEVIAEAMNDLQAFQQSPSTGAVDFSRKLYQKALRMGNVLPDRVIRSRFIEGLHPGIRDHMRHYYAEHPKVTLGQLARYAESIDSLNSTKPKPVEKKAQKNTERGNRHVLPVDGSTTPSSVTTMPTTDSGGQAVMAMQGGSHSGRTPSSGPSSFTSYRSNDSYVHCRVCLSKEHSMDKCPFLNDKRQECVATREANFQAQRKKFPPPQASTPSTQASGTGHGQAAVPAEARATTPAATPPQAQGN